MKIVLQLPSNTHLIGSTAVTKCNIACQCGHKILLIQPFDMIQKFLRKS